jgi:hypothetical protein
MSHGSCQSEHELMETIFVLNAMGCCALEVAGLDNDTISSDHFQQCLNHEHEKLAE